MKPLNRDEPGCNFTSSNCVIWQGPDIPCIALCKGDTVSDVVHKLATELCDVLTNLDVSTLDITCLNLTTCTPKTFHDFLQVIIDTICELKACCNGNPSTPIPDSFNSIVVPVAPSFQYVNEFGDTVTTMTVTQYVIAIGNRVDTQTNQISALETTVATHTDQITVLQNEVAAIPPPNTDLIVPVCVLPAIPTSPNDVLVELEKQFCELSSATGNASEIYQALLAQCVGLSTDSTLGGGGGNMAGIPGWNNTVLNLAAAINNIWLTLCDTRSAIKNIQINCCAAGCDGITLNLSAVLVGTSATLYLTGTIPSGFANCAPSGSLVTITDDTGGVLVTNMDLITYLNFPSGYIISLSGTPINLLSNIHINIEACLSNSSTNALCQSILNYTIASIASCPALVYTPGTDSIAYSGPSVPTGTMTYTVELWDNLGVTLITSQSQLVTFPNLVAGLFTALTINTQFRARVVVTPAAGPATTCPFVPVALTPTSLFRVPLGTASSFVMLGDTGVSSGVPSVFVGNVGTSSGLITGITAPDVTGILYPVADPVVLQAEVDLVNAIAVAGALTPIFTLPLDDVSGTTVTPGYWDTPLTNLVNNGVLTLDAGGDVNAVFTFLVTGAITFGFGSSVVLINGADWNNVTFVSLTPGALTSIADNVIIKGTVLSNGVITVGATDDLQGRLLSTVSIPMTGPNNLYNI